MPKPQKVTRSDGSVRFKVRFRDGATNASESFVTEKHAKDFCKLVDALGGARARAVINEHKAEEVIGAKTLAEVADLWLAWKSARDAKGNPIRVDAPYTLTRYEQIIRLHITPALGHMPINLIGEGDVQAWADQVAANRSAKTVADAHSLLHSIYKWANAKAQGFAVIDPCTETSLPKKRKNIAKGIRPDEWAILYAAAIERDPHAADLLLFLYASGWRWSEAVALRSMDVDDFGDGHVVVNMGRILRRTDNNQWEFVEDDAKSSAGIRSITLGRYTSVVIRRRREGLKSEDPIFTNRLGRQWRYSSFHSDIWTFNELKQDKAGQKKKRILQIAHDMGLHRADQITLHWLRHGHGGWMAREDMAGTQKRLGHEDIRTTIGTYGSLIGDVNVEVLDRFDEVLAPAAVVDGPDPAADLPALAVGEVFEADLEQVKDDA